MTTASQIYFGCQVPIASTIIMKTRRFKEQNTPFKARQSQKVSIFRFLLILIAGKVDKVKSKLRVKSHARLVHNGDKHHEGPGTGQTCNRL